MLAAHDVADALAGDILALVGGKLFPEEGDVPSKYMVRGRCTWWYVVSSE